MRNQGSFKDPVGVVYEFESHVERSCRPESTQEIRALLDSPFFSSLVQSNKVLSAHWCNEKQRVLQNRLSGWSYPFEWSFSMLKDAALLLLEIEHESLDNGYSLKDGCAYNITFQEGKPIFVDIYSLESFHPTNRMGALRSVLSRVSQPTTTAKSF